MIRTFVLGAIFFGLFVSCGDDGGNIAIVDAAIPDAMPDAAPMVCEGEMCDGLCVDTSMSSEHCGGCDMACDSPGQLCGGQLPCVCPDPVVTALIEPSGLDMFFEPLAPIRVAAWLNFSTVLNTFLVYYTLDDPIGVEVELMGLDFQNQATPGLAAGYNVDTATAAAQTPYAAIEGTLILNSRCADGVSGSATNVRFVEVVSALNPTPIEGGCEMFLPTIDFAVGQPCDMSQINLN